MAKQSINPAQIKTPDIWHVVGAAGEPTFQNSWVNFSAAYEDTAFMKDALGWVTVKGFIKSGTVTAGTLIFTLPAGYRPLRNMYYSAPVNGGTAAVEITTNGYVQAGSAINATFTAIPFLRFKAEL